MLGAPSGHLVESLGLDVVFPAFFLALLLEEVRSARAALVAALLGAGVAAALVWWLPAGVALVGATMGALVGLRARAPDPAVTDSADCDSAVTDQGDSGGAESTAGVPPASGEGGGVAR